MAVHVAAVTPLYPPESRVGAWLATHEYLKACVDAGHTVTCVASLASGPGYWLDGVDVLNGVKHIQDVVRSADVVVSHLGDQGTAHEFAVKRGVPSVRMVHGLATVNQLRRFRQFPVSLMVWNSESSRVASGWDGPSLVARPPLIPERYVTNPGSCVTQVNISDAKGGQLFGKLVRFMPDLEFLAVRGGYGRQRDPYGRNVRIMLPTHNMRDDVYAQTRIVTIPSKWETWGMVGPEAMCSGIPVIAAPTPGLRESLGAAGIFVETANFQGWVNAVRNLSDVSAWQVASERSLERAAELAAQDDRPRFVEALEGLV